MDTGAEWVVSLLASAVWQGEGSPLSHANDASADATRDFLTIVSSGGVLRHALETVPDNWPIR